MHILVWSHVHHVQLCKKRRDQVCVQYIIICEKMCVYERMSSEGYEKLIMVIPLKMESVGWRKR